MPDEDVQVNLATVLDGNSVPPEQGSVTLSEVPYPGTQAAGSGYAAEAGANPGNTVPDFAEPPMQGFKEAQSRHREAVGSLRDLYTQQGRFGEIGKSANYKADLYDLLDVDGLAAPPAFAQIPDAQIPEPPTPYQAASSRRREIVDDLRNKYTEAGDFAKIGTAGYKTMEQNALASAGLAEPASVDTPRPFQAAQSRRRDIEYGLQDSYAEQGRAGEVGHSALYKSDLNDLLSPEGLAAPEAAPDFAARPYAAAQSRSREIEQDLQDEFAEEGNLSGIGKDEYNKKFRKQRESAGLIKKETPLGRLTEDKMGLAFGLGFSAIGIGSGIASLAEQSNGQYVSPEQQNAGVANAALPGVGGILGTVIGGMISPAAGLAGQFIGGAGGQAASAFIGAGQEREQATREAAERLAAALGEASSQVGTFKAQIEATGAPVAQLGKALDTAGSVGTAGQNTIAGTGALVNAFGENTERNFAAIAKYTSDPLLSGLGQQFAAGNLDVTGIQSLGFAAAERGDFTNLKTFQQAAEEAAGKNSPEYQAQAKELAGRKGSIWYQFDNWTAGLSRQFGWGGTSLTEDQQAATNAARPASDEGVAAKQNQSALTAINLTATGIVADSQVQQAGSGISLARAKGGGAAEIGAASGALYTSLAAARVNTQAEISFLTTEAADPVNESRRMQLTSQIAQANAKLSGYDAEEASQRRDVFTTGLDENNSAFNLQGLRSRLSGASSASVSGITAQQVSFLNNTAANPQNPLMPTERDALQSSAAQLAYTQAQGIYADENGAIAIGRASRGADTARAQTFGSPLEVYSARIAGLQSNRDQITQNNSELSRGNLTFGQRQDLTRQNIQIQSDLTNAPELARIAAYDAEGGILADTQGQSRTNLSRDTAIRGSRAYADQIAGDTLQVNLFRGAAAGSPAGSAQSARFGRQAADAAAQRDSDTENSQIYRETAAERTEDLTTAGSYRRAKNAPFLSGPESNPLTAGNSLLSNLQRRERGAEAALAASTDSLARERNTALVEGYKDRINDFERDRLYNGLLPQEVQSRIGMPGGGAGVAVQPLAAVSAAYGDYNPTQGGFGAHPSGYHSSVNTAPEGGAAGAFALHLGGAATGGAAGSADPAAKTADNTKELVGLFRDFLRHIQTAPNHPPAATGQVGSYARSLNPGARYFETGM